MTVETGTFEIVPSAKVTPPPTAVTAFDSAVSVAGSSPDVPISTSRASPSSKLSVPSA